MTSPINVTGVVNTRTQKTLKKYAHPVTVQEKECILGRNAQTVKQAELLNIK